MPGASNRLVSAVFVTWCNEELEALGLADREGENIRPPDDGLSMWEPKQNLKKHILTASLLSWMYSESYKL